MSIENEGNYLSSSDVIENDMRKQMPHIFEILLLDRTTSSPKKLKNIIWANDNYTKYGFDAYSPTAQIKLELITGSHGSLIMPRASKTRTMQKERTKTKAEVFTPLRIVKIQNDAVDETYKNDDLETYIGRKWLEITCGEAPYMVTRYDMETGEMISLDKRTGFVDRKMARINAETQDKAEWQRLVELAYKSSYGFEWNGDSLLLARENLLYTYRDYYYAKWNEEPILGLLEEIAKIISYNVFQMDGLKYIIPLTEKKEWVEETQLSMFDLDEPKGGWKITPGKRVKIMNWGTNKTEFFYKGVVNKHENK